MTVYRFFLGGRDLEMLEIRRLLEHKGKSFEDDGLAWGARLSAYEERLQQSLAVGETPVLIELMDDLPDHTFDRKGVVTIDHHGERAGRDKPSSLAQVFKLLGLRERDWTRRMKLVAANDVGHIAAMQRAGATEEEIRAIRAEDRQAQGITEEDEERAREAIAQRKEHGRLTIVRIDSDHCNLVDDLMHPVLGGPGHEGLLIEGRSELGFYGSGRIIEELADEPGSWSGGDLPTRGFWGIRPRDEAERKHLIARIRQLAG